jgi:hypothetical protein
VWISFLCSMPKAFHHRIRPGAVKRAPGFGAAEQTLDGEGRSEIIAREGKGWARSLPVYPLQTPNTQFFQSIDGQGSPKSSFAAG